MHLIKGEKKKLKLLFKLIIKLIIKLTRLCSEAVTYSSTGFMILTYNREKQQYTTGKPRTMDQREDDNGNRARDYDPGLNAARSMNLVTRFIAIVLRFPAKSS